MQVTSYKMLLKIGSATPKEKPDLTLTTPDSKGFPKTNQQVK